MKKCLACTQLVNSDLKCTCYENKPDPFAVVDVETELQVYNLRVENEFLKQKVEELSQEVANLKDGQYAAMEQHATELEQEVEEVAASRNFWKNKAEDRYVALEKSVEVNAELTRRIQKLEEVLKGKPAPRSETDEEVMQWMQKNSKLMDMLGDE